jgi:hypothetical protein
MDEDRLTIMLEAESVREGLLSLIAKGARGIAKGAKGIAQILRGKKGRAMKAIRSKYDQAVWDKAKQEFGGKDEEDNKR